MTFIKSLAQFLQEENVGIIEKTIWGELPLGKENSIGLLASPSTEPNKSIPYYQQTIDIWGRFKSAGDGQEKLQQVFDLLHRKANYDIDGYHIYLSYAAGMIDDLGRDPEQRHLYKVTLVFVHRRLVA